MDNVGFRVKKITRDRGGYYRMILHKGSIPPKGLAIYCMHQTSEFQNMWIKNWSHWKKKKKNLLLQLEDNTTQLSTDETSRQKISKDTEEHNETINHQNPIDIYRV